MLVLIKLTVVLFVIAIGIGYVAPKNWTEIAVEQRVLPGQHDATKLVKEVLAGTLDPAKPGAAEPRGLSIARPRELPPSQRR